MKLTVETKKFFESITSPTDRDKFVNKYGKTNFQWGMEVSLPDKWTDSQRGTVWGDYSITAKLLYTSKEFIYEQCREAETLKEYWTTTETVGRPGHERTHEHKQTLTELSDDDISKLIPAQRELMEDWVQQEYQEIILINWHCKENMGKPQWEMTGEPYWRATG